MRLTTMAGARPTDDVQEQLQVAVKEFLSNSSMHGLKYIGESSRSYVERIFWVLIFLSSVAASGYLCFTLWQSWKENPIIVTFETQRPRADEFSAFPAVSICSVGQVSLRNLDNVVKRYRSVQENLLRETFILLAMPPMERDAEQLQRRITELNKQGIHFDRLLDDARDVVPSCEDMILDVSYQSVAVQEKNYFIKSLTDLGLCCTFNAGSYAVPTFGFQRHAENVSKFQGTGRFNGLHVILNYQVDDLEASTSHFRGFRVLVHHPNEFPMVSDLGIATGTGFTTFVALDAVGYYHTPPVANLSPEKRSCYFDREGNLKYFDKYTKSACLEECTVNQTIHRCKCRPYYFKDSFEIDICQPRLYQCYKDVRVGVWNESISCNCKTACTNLWYDETFSSAPFPGGDFHLTRTYKRVLKHLESRNIPFRLESLSQVCIFLKESHGQFYKVDVRYGPEDLVSSIGGLLGIGLGFSLISAVELLYFLCIHFVATYRCRADKVSWRDPVSALADKSLKSNRAVAWSVDNQHVHFNNTLIPDFINRR